MVGLDRMALLRSLQATDNAGQPGFALQARDHGDPAPPDRPVR